MTSRALPAVLAWSLLGCQHPAGDPATPAPPAARSTQAMPPGDAEPSKEPPRAKYQALIDAKLRLIQSLRGLEATGPVAGEVLTAGQIVEHVEQALDREVPEHVLRAANWLLYLSGSVDETFDYRASMLEVMGSDLAGFYDPERRAMFLRAGLGREEWGATLAHELVHALQDQHYGLQQLTKWRPNASDQRSAVHALAEGDAMSAMFDQMVVGTGRTALDLPDSVGELSIGGLASRGKVPDVVLRLVVAPYVDGLRFVNALRTRGGWREVDAAWRAPPETTEQVLHPDKYLAREKPEQLEAIGFSPAPELELIYDDTEGEQSLRVLLEEWLSKKAATLAASGWAGDRLTVHASGDRGAFVWRIRYDTEPEAKRAAELLGGWLNSRGKPWRASETRCVDDATRGPLALTRRERDLTVVGGPNRGATHKAARCSDTTTRLERSLGRP